MIDTRNKRKVVVVGYPQSTLAQEFHWWIQEEFKSVEIQSPESIVISDEFAYIVSVSKFKNDRQHTLEILKDQTFATFVHSSVVKHGHSYVGAGTFVGPCSSMYFDSVIGDHCIVGPYSMISHNTKIGNNNIIHPGTMIAGSCVIGDQCFFGMRSTVIDKISICDNVFVGAGSMVTKSINEPGRYIGSPARKKSEEDQLS
jgi:carbonic anhydrase/acetyltransferase-like protein (isoleucine patch superfamily)